MCTVTSSDPRYWHGLQYGILPGNILNNMLFKMERDYNDVVYDDSST